MKKLLILLFLIPFIGFGQTFTWIKTDQISSTRTDFIDITDTIILPSSDTLWKVAYSTDTIFINDDTVLIVGDGTAYGFYHSGSYTILVNPTDNVAIGVDTARYKFNVKGTTHSDRFRGVPNDYQALVTFSVDDGSTSDYTILKPLFTAKGINGIINIITDQIGGGGKMTWDQVRGMQAAGWEIGSHSITHADMTAISADSVRIEMRDSKATLEAESLTDINNWTFPGNQSGTTSREICREYYRSGSAGSISDTFNNPKVLRSYRLSRVSYNDASRLALLKRMVDNAITDKTWTIVYIHTVVTADSVALAELIDYIQAKGSVISIVTLNEGLDIVGNNYDHADGFSVNGEDMRINGAIYRDGSTYTYPFIHTWYDTTESCDGANLFMGEYSGNQTSSPSGAGANYASYNTGLGSYTLEALTTGFNNTAVGAYALDSNTTGYANTAIGYEVMINNTAGISNTAIGGYAMQASDLADQNIAIGNYALRYNTGATSDYNTAIGYASITGADGSSANTFNTAVGAYSLYTATTGSYNTAVGGYAGSITTTQSENVFLGYKAGRLNTGSKNVLIGVEAGENTTTHHNVHIGYKAADSDDGGNACVNIGYYAGRAAGGASAVRIGWTAGENDDAIGNVLIGYNAGKAASIGNYNVITGFEAGKVLTSTGNVLSGYKSGTKITSGGNNTLLGYGTGINALVTGSGNIFIGYLAGYNETGSNKLYIENSSATTALIHGDFANDYVLINDYLGITGGGAEFSPTIPLVVKGNSDIQGNLTTDTFIIDSPSVPGSASATGTTGTIAWDANYIYVCVATDTWERVATSTW